ncbi:MAG: hypothetical protein EPO68_12275 [Planctomycetota bacterium]|nr:MAG: hypothetical protein EPO68_12275 [Planctomycetota bacterium]
MLTALLACVALCAQEPAPASQPATRPAAFAFAWPVGSRGRVKEAQSKDGVDLAMSSELVLSARAPSAPAAGADAAGELLLERGDPRIESYRGYSASHPFVQKLILKLDEASPVQPALVLGPDGALRGLANYDAILDDLVQRQAAAGLTKEEQRVARERLSSEAERARAERQMREQWDAWVAHWIGVPLEAGWTETRELSFELPSGKRARTGSVERRVRGLEERAGASCWHLSRFEQRSGPWFFKHVGGQLPQWMPGLELSKVRACTLFDQVDAWIDVQTLRPLEVTRRHALRVELAADDPAAPSTVQKSENTSTWTFEWSAPAK